MFNSVLSLNVKNLAKKARLTHRASKASPQQTVARSQQVQLASGKEKLPHPDLDALVHIGELVKNASVQTGQCKINRHWQRMFCACNTASLLGVKGVWCPARLDLSNIGQTVS
uniref:(northern house mosquito) hypothetical protein n=1 Tax=Culex pipiens TaxID=7175 RepID=A0A8D8A8P4_CULPI